MSNKLYSVLLAALLVVTQFGLAAHQIDFAHHDGTPCAVCVAAHGLDYAGPATPAAIGIQAPVDPLLVWAPLPPLSRTPVLRVARSPPLVSLHA